MSYLSEAKEDAQSTAENFRDEIIEKFLEGEVSNDLLNDYSDGDAYHHESHTDKSYDLLESANVLSELDDYEETDSGLWESLGPREAIAAQAAYTYANAVYSMWRDLVEVINEDVELDLLRDNLDEVEDEVADELAESESDYDNDEGDYEAPFSEDEEVERRQNEIKAKISARIDALIAAFTE